MTFHTCKKTSSLHKLLLLASFAVLLTLLLSSLKVQAAPKWESKKTQDWVGSVHASKSLNKYYVRIVDADGSVKKVKSSQPSVASAKRSKYDDTTIEITAKKAGKTKISCMVDGKKLTHTFTVKKYANPVSSLTLGGIELARYFSKNTVYKLKKDIEDLSYAITAKPGWQITGCCFRYGPNSYTGLYQKNFKKPKTVFTYTASLTQGGTCFAVLQNKKSKVTEMITIDR